MVEPRTSNTELSDKIKNGRKPKEPILIIEDRTENQTLLTALCKRLGMSSEVAENGQIALDKSKSQNYSLYLVDLMMPVMDGKTFISELKRDKPDAVCIVQTAVDQNEEIIEIMKLGVYDYIIKPFHVELVLDRLEKAIEYVYLKQMEGILLAEEHRELKDQLEWLNYKESHRKSKDLNAEVHAILNLKTTLTQGSGIGAMTTLIDSIDLMKQESGDEYKIHKEFWDLLSENNQHTLSMLKGLDSSVNILQGTINLKPISSDELIRLLPILSSEFSEELEKKKVKVNLPIVKTKTSLSCDLDLLKIALRELFVNGIKYSETNSNFDIFMTFVDGYFCLSLKNNVMDDEYNKLIPSHEKQLVLPFFRIHPPVESFYKKEPFSLGLGLTMVDFILQKHHGMFFIRKAIDHTCEKSHCVISEIFLPIQTTKDKTT